MVDANHLLKLLPTSTLDTYKVLEHIDMLPMGIQQQPKQVYPCEGDSPGTAGGGSRVHKVLASTWHFALGGLMKVDGYICQ
jgi:hypothetical protein